MLGIDARFSVIEDRLKGVKRIIAVSACKGGVGKSVIACSLALKLAERGYKVGLLDLDFFSPSDHMILGIKPAFPQEEKGLLPPTIYGIKFMSIIYFIEDKPAPLRGIDVSNAIIELLAITIWKELDFLIIDMPPGIGDATLEIIRAIKRLEFLLVSTQSKLAWESVERMVKMLKQQSIPVIGIIENMKQKDSDFIKRNAKDLGIRYLGAIKFDPGLEDSLSSVEKISKTEFAKWLEDIIPKLLQQEKFK